MTDTGNLIMRIEFKASRPLVCLIVPLLWWGQRAAAGEPTAIGSRLELFVDDALIDRMTGDVALRLNAPTAREVSIVHDAPWEGGTSGYHSVLKDGNRYLMYYRGHAMSFDASGLRETHREVTCYAESADGIHWTKPHLGLVEFDGSTANNIVWQGPESHNLSAFLDANPACKPEQRFKAFGGVTGGLTPLTSADGVHWEKLVETPVITEGAFDSQNVGFWDPARGRYAAYFRFFTSAGLREIAVAYSDDFLKWTAPQPIAYTHSAGGQQMYTNQVVPYDRAPHVLFGFPTRYVARPLTAHVQTIEPVDVRLRLISAIERGGTDLTDGLFMSSRDGTTFRRWDEAFLRPGPQGEGRWMYGDNYQSWGLVETAPSIPGGPPELSFYSSEGAWRDDYRMRRYTMRLDGFVSAHAGFAGGEVITKPLTFTGKELVINYATSAAGSVQIELQTADGQPIHAFELADCPELYGDTVEQVVAWKSGTDVSTLAGRPVRLRFVLRDADVYSFRFR